MEPEIKIVTREETFNDLAVRELAKTQARCMCLLQYKRCSKKACANCKSCKRLMSCKACMNDYDKERLDNYTLEYYNKYSQNPMAWMGHKQFVKTYNGFIGALILCLILLLGCVFLAGGPFDKPPVPKLNYDVMIVTTIQSAQVNIRDLDRDGKINCVDYATMFKITWDQTYPLLKNKCQIVRNVNPNTGMNHLFVHVWNDRSESIDIEPWTQNPYVYRMQDIWGDRYSPEYNKYGETDYWLNEVKN